MKRYSKKTVIQTAVLIILFIGIIYSCLHTNQIEIKKPNQFALLSCYSPEDDRSNLVPLKIEDGILYAYEEDGTRSVVELEGRASQVFSGENLCVLLEDGSIYYDGMTELSEPEDGENFPLSEGYAVVMAGKVLELNETEPFLAVNQNIEYLNFKALLESGELICETNSGGFRYYTLPEEKPIELSGDFILTENGNVYYLYGDAEILYDGGDIAAISACETASRCIGLKENGQAVSWWMDLEAPDVSGWKNIVAVKQGFYFAVGLDANGKVYFATDDAELEKNVTAELSQWSDVTEIAVLFETIAGMKEDGSCLFLDVANY